LHTVPVTVKKAPHPGIGVPGVHGKMGIPEGTLLPFGIFP